MAPKGKESSDRSDARYRGAFSPLEGDGALRPRQRRSMRKVERRYRRQKVKEGQVLAEVETPEIDQELDQARAQLAQAQAALVVSGLQANRELSRANLARYKQLIPAGVVSQADLDQRSAQAQVDEATVTVSSAAISAQEANMRRLTQLKSFSHVLAPFDGVVTQRWVEVGALVTAGNGQPLYKVAAMDPARVFVQVPQDVAPGVRADGPAQVTVREYAGRIFQGKVSRAAGELDPRDPNDEHRGCASPTADGALMAGMYSDVALILPSHRTRSDELPATALMSDAKGQRVAVVDARLEAATSSRSCWTTRHRTHRPKSPSGLNGQRRSASVKLAIASGLRSTGCTSKWSTRATGAQLLSDAA